ncbi:uncharacterized protein LOC115739106 [Rhodamnia argentea]|uniref:Uncharacterized protein LOC115739106 n=1 Tax=Rhodamnia argentea TaxID=178133 RepID=A0A8B8P010_9MYRT|nr:uncharacterized protein LOC115739106 [Rhodamnia argentea]
MTSLHSLSLLFLSPSSSSSSSSSSPSCSLLNHRRRHHLTTRHRQWPPRLRSRPIAPPPPPPPRLFSVSCSKKTRRHLRRRRRHVLANPDTADAKSSKLVACDEHSVELTIDFTSWSARAKSGFGPLVSAGRDAYADLSTLVTLDDSNRMVISCRRSTIQFVGSVVALSFVVVFALKVVVQLVLGFRSRFGYKKNEAVVVRRDRSLGGREVVVATRKEVDGSRVLDNPLSPALQGTVHRSPQRRRRNFTPRLEEKLPEWWPAATTSSAVDLEVDKEYYQREANRLVREIVDNRLRGKDIMVADIVQLRRICRTSGIRVSFGTENTRDSFYRVSVDFVLNMCNHSSGRSISLEIDGEDPRQFLAGLAGNIGLETIRAARIVSAAVAARTRSGFLQAWALEMQGEHSEALAHLSNICVLHQIFPPRDFSPEMEMVALGLERQLKPEQREYLLNMLVGVCGEERPKSLGEALGLELSLDDGAGDHYERSLS